MWMFVYVYQSVCLCLCVCMCVCVCVCVCLCMCVCTCINTWVCMQNKIGNSCDNQACLNRALWFNWCGWIILSTLNWTERVANQTGGDWVRSGTGLAQISVELDISCRHGNSTHSCISAHIFLDTPKDILDHSLADNANWEMDGNGFLM